MNDLKQIAVMPIGSVHLILGLDGNGRVWQGTLTGGSHGAYGIDWRLMEETIKH